MAEQRYRSHLIWLDLEMTGLHVEKDSIIEIATLITDSDLNVIAEGPVYAIHQPNEVLIRMDAWNRDHHGQSGLINRVRQSKINELEAQKQTLEFLKQHVPEGHSPMCGNSICQDRRFLARYMPKLERYFHYRNLDVSTLKELAWRWRSEIMQALNKESAHIALADIYESIAELRYYRQHFLK